MKLELLYFGGIESKRWMIICPSKISTPPNIDWFSLVFF